MAGIGMFMLKQGSRNALNLDGKDPVFRSNFEKLFHTRLVHLDTCDKMFREVDDAALEAVKVGMVSKLIRGKKLEQYKFSGHYLVAIDATGIASFPEQHCEQCLQKTSKNGQTTFFHTVLEAKLITPSGLSLSMATEWISNEGKTEFEKQDCEREAFKRLSKKLKKFFPRLPIAIVADGLYPWEGFFDICGQNQWKYIVVLKDGSLKSLQQEIGLEKRITPGQTASIIRAEKQSNTTLNYHWLAQLPYRKHQLNFVECIEMVVDMKTKKESRQRFVHLTNFEVDREMCDQVSYAGRLRQKIENEGFNIQKNHGYNLEHKFSRVSFQAMKIYYQCLQIAHIINQMAEATLIFKNLKNSIPKCTVKYLWKRFVSYLLENEIDEIELNQWVSNPFQIRMA